MTICNQYIGSPTVKQALNTTIARSKGEKNGEHYASLVDTLQGVGGVVGLLAVSANGLFYFPAYDNNGNITKYIDESGNVVAAYEYDDFGRTISSSGQLAHLFRHRFSTKYFDAETGLYYYGYRFYSPALMRWINRDPIEEEGGVNLYGFCGNAIVHKVDKLGNNIYLFTGNNSGAWLNDHLHQSVGVDVWSKRGHKMGITTFTFAYNGNWGWNMLSFSWLGFSGFTLPGYLMEGEVEERNPVGKIDAEKKTSCREDRQCLKYMRTKVGTRDVYSVGRHNCRNFSQTEFSAAPGERIK